MTDKEPTRRGGGRPRGFDREEALAKATDLFWRHGYEGVSLSDLTTAMGIAAPSLYAAFGSKAALYREALDRYSSGPSALNLRRLEQADSLEDALKVLLTAAAGVAASSGRACMITSGMLTCHPDHDALAQELTDRRRSFQAELAAKLVRWVAPPEAAALARYLLVIMQGLSAQARDGASVGELAEIVARVSASQKHAGAV